MEKAEPYKLYDLFDTMLPQDTHKETIKSILNGKKLSLTTDGWRSSWPYMLVTIRAKCISNTLPYMGCNQISLNK